MTADQTVTTQSILRDPDFRRFYLSRSVSFFGDALHAVALVTFVYLKAGSAEAVGASLFSLMAPRIVFSLFAGALSDRWDRKRIMIVTDLYRAAAVAAIPFVPSLPLLYVLLMTLSGAESFAQISRASALPDILHGQNAMIRGNSLLQSTTAALQIIGPVTAGVIIAAAGTTAVFFIDSGTFLLSALLLLPVRFPQPAGPGAPAPLSSYLKQIFNGFLPLFRDRVLSSLVLAYTLLTAAVFLVAGLRIVFAHRYLGHYGSAAEVYGLIIGVSSAGTLAGGLLLPVISQFAQNRTVIIAGIALTGLELFCYAATDRLPVILGAALVSGIAFLLASLTMSTLFQVYTDRERRGRTLAFVTVLVSFLSAVALAAGGMLADAWGVRSVFLAAGILCVLICLVGMALPGLRGHSGQPAQGSESGHGP